MANTKKSLHLPANPNLRNFQEYVRDLVEVRGFKNTTHETFMLFLEECGELSKAARDVARVKPDAKTALENLGYEAADVFIYLLDICNRHGVDLEAAFRAKEEINKVRFGG